MHLPESPESSAQSASCLLKQYCLARTTVPLLFLKVVLQGPSMLLDDALHAPKPSYHKRTCPSIDGECCVKCALVTKQYCLHRFQAQVPGTGSSKAALLLPPQDAEKTMLCH